ncbi:WD40 repeat domain-containing protein [Streptosporangium sp. LJ11]|uniref:WD40 repeat domain-containing protein n=1 Tax=Streptosporangium sp. LJ11 TaxID=3436927 RepID=UPI003F7B3276
MTDTTLWVNECERYLFEEPRDDDAAEILRTELRGPFQPLFDLVAKLVAARRFDSLEALYRGVTPLHHELCEITGFRSDPEFARRAGGPFVPEETRASHAVRALAGLGLSLIADEVQREPLRAALAWYGEARYTAAGAPGWRPEDVAGDDIHLLGRLELLCRIAGEARFTGATLACAMTLRTLSGAGGRTSRPQAITVLFDRGTDGQLATLRGTLLRGLPPALVPDAARMSLFSGDERFADSLRAAWQQAGAKRVEGMVLWSLDTEKGPLSRVDDESLGAAFSVVIDEIARLQRPLSGLRTVRRLVAKNAVIGAVGAKGVLRSVGGYERKLGSLPENARVIVPEPDYKTARAQARPSLEIVPAANWRDAARLARRNDRGVIVRNALVFFLLLAAGGGTYGLVMQDYQRDAEAREMRQRREAVAAQFVEDSQNGAGNDPQLAMLLAGAASKLKPGPESRYAMRSALVKPAVARLDAACGGVTDVAYSPDGRTFAVACSDRSVRIWDAATLRQIGAPLTGHEKRALSVAYDSEGKTLASGGEDGTIRLWDVAAHRAIGTPLTGHRDWVTSVVFNPVARRFASAGHDDTVRLWDLDARRQIGAPLTGHRGDVLVLAYSPDGRTLASGGTDKTVRIWDPASRRRIGAPIKGHTDAVTALAFDKKRPLLASGGTDKTIRIWNTGTRRAFGGAIRGHDSWISALEFSSDTITLASAGLDNSVRFWNVPTHQAVGPVLAGHAGPLYAMAFASDGRTIISGSEDGTVRVWDIRPLFGVGIPFINHTWGVIGVAYSPDGKTLATGGEDKTVRLWDVATQEQIGKPLKGHTGPVLSVAFSPDGSLLASGGHDDSVRLWDVRKRRPVGKPMTGHRDDVYSLAFRPGGKILASGSQDKTVLLWDVSSREEAGVLQGHNGTVTSLAFNHDGRSMVTGSEDGVIRLWDLTHQNITMQPMTGHADAILGIAYSPDGRTVASASQDHTVRLWDVTTRKQIGTPLLGHRNYVNSVAFSPDGSTLATTSDDKTVRLWDVENGRQIGDPIRDQETELLPGLYKAAFSPDGRYLATSITSDINGMARLWDVGALTGDPLKHICARARRDLRPDEWRRYAPGVMPVRLC